MIFSQTLTNVVREHITVVITQHVPMKLDISLANVNNIMMEMGIIAKVCN